MPQIHTIIQISQVYYPFCHNLWWKFSGKIFELRKKNKQTQFSLLFYFLMHFSFLPWWCTLKMEALVRFCKKTFPGFPTWEIQLLLNTVICPLNSILRFLVCWLGPWPVNWMSPVRIPPKSLVTYILLKFLKNGCFCFSIIPLWIHNIEVKSFLKLYSDFLGSQIWVD